MVLNEHNEMQYMEGESSYDTISVQEFSFAVVKTMNNLPKPSK